MSGSLLATQLGTLSEMIDFTDMVTYGKSFIKSVWLQSLFKDRMTAQYLVYAVAAFTLGSFFVSDAYVVVSAVDSGIQFDRGFYADYAGYSWWVDYLGVWEGLVLFAYFLWAIVDLGMGFGVFSCVWDKLTNRLAEAEEHSISIETPLSWNKAMKVYVLCLIVVFAQLLSAYSLGGIAPDIINFLSEYDDDEQNEAQDLNGNDDPAGQSAKWDIILHLVTAIYGHFVLGGIGMYSVMFHFAFIDFSLIDDGFTCDLEEDKYNFDNYYNQILPMRAKLTDKNECRKYILDIMKIVDTN
jgi:hypothetical protein